MTTKRIKPLRNSKLSGIIYSVLLMNFAVAVKNCLELKILKNRLDLKNRSHEHRSLVICDQNVNKEWLCNG